VSTFIAAAQPQIILRRNDRQLVEMEFQYREPDDDYMSEWWPQKGGFAGDLGVDVSMLVATRGWTDPEITSGTSQRLGFVGVTRDAQGAPLGNCTVRVFRTSDGALVHETVSDANGAFLGCAYDGNAYFLVFYKSGTPDVFGTTVNTLIGS
jgi:hypothetical protein